MNDPTKVGKENPAPGKPSNNPSPVLGRGNKQNPNPANSNKQPRVEGNAPPSNASPAMGKKAAVPVKQQPAVLPAIRGAAVEPPKGAPNESGTRPSDGKLPAVAQEQGTANGVDSSRNNASPPDAPLMDESMSEKVIKLTIINHNDTRKRLTGESIMKPELPQDVNELQDMVHQLQDQVKLLAYESNDPTSAAAMLVQVQMRLQSEREHYEELLQENDVKWATKMRELELRITANIQETNRLNDVQQWKKELQQVTAERDELREELNDTRTAAERDATTLQKLHREVTEIRIRHQKALDAALERVDTMQVENWKLMGQIRELQASLDHEKKVRKSMQGMSPRNTQVPTNEGGAIRPPPLTIPSLPSPNARRANGQASPSNAGSPTLSRFAGNNGFNKALVDAPGGSSPKQAHPSIPVMRNSSTTKDSPSPALARRPTLSVAEKEAPFSKMQPHQSEQRKVEQPVTSSVHGRSPTLGAGKLAPLPKVEMRANHNVSQQQNSPSAPRANPPVATGNPAQGAARGKVPPPAKTSHRTGKVPPGDLVKAPPAPPVVVPYHSKHAEHPWNNATPVWTAYDRVEYRTAHQQPDQPQTSPENPEIQSHQEESPSTNRPKLATIAEPKVPETFAGASEENPQNHVSGSISTDAKVEAIQQQQKKDGERAVVQTTKESSKATQPRGGGKMGSTRGAPPAPSPFQQMMEQKNIKLPEAPTK